MSIDAEIAHLFSPPPDGFDANSDGVIQTRDESVRADRNYDLWDGERLFLAAGQQRENITRSTLDAWFRSFDTNHDGRLTQTLRSGHSSGEFAQACRAVWGDPDACRYVTLTAFEKRA